MEGIGSLIMEHKVFSLIVLFMVLASAETMIGAVAKAIVRVRGRGDADRLRAELEQAHERIAELEGRTQQLASLEERLEFAERLLARGEGRPARPDGSSPGVLP